MSSATERTEIDDRYTWDLEAMFASDAAWEEAFEAAEAKLEQLAAYEGRVTESATTLQELLTLRDEIMREISSVGAYARMRSDEDTANQQYQALSARAQSLGSEAASAASFIDPELQRAGRDQLQSFIEESAELEQYAHYFDDVCRMEPHTRDPAVEELLAELSEVTGAGGDVYSMLTNADMEFPAVETPSGEDKRLTLSNFTVVQKNPDRAYRERAYTAFYDTWGDVRNAVGTALKNAVRTNIKTANARRYESARAASLTPPNVPTEVYDTLLETVEANLDVLHRHVDLKRERLAVDTLEMWDLYAPLTESSAPTIEYEQAKEWVIEAVAPLGEAYQSRMAEGLASRWVDVYETANKRAGAYSSGTYDSQPYILMNYQEDVSSLYTLAHELGHSMHSELASETQPYVYSGYEIFTAEVASTVNEALLTNHLLETVTDETLRRHVLDEYLERFRSTLFRQAMFASFEQQIHERSAAGEALTPDTFDSIYGELKGEFYQPAAVDDRIAREWMRIPHFYYNFYVYQYATGIAAANAIVQRIDTEGEAAADAYRQFLRSGSREYPLELLRTAGVDMASSAPVEAAIESYDALVGEFEQLS